MPKNHTRISYEEGAESDVLKWEEGDQLTVFAGEYGFDGNRIDYTLISGAGTQTATFQGPALGEVKDVKVYYKSKHLIFLIECNNAP